MTEEIVEEIIDPLMVCYDCHSISVKFVLRKAITNGKLEKILILKCVSCGRWKYTIDKNLLVSPVKKWKKPKPTTTVNIFEGEN